MRGFLVPPTLLRPVLIYLAPTWGFFVPEIEGNVMTFNVFAQPGYVNGVRNSAFVRLNDDEGKWETNEAMYCHPRFAPRIRWIIAECKRLGIRAWPTEVFRSLYMQQFWLDYWTKLGLAGNASRVGFSAHGLGLAGDWYIHPDDHVEFVAVCRRAGVIFNTSESWHNVPSEDPDADVAAAMILGTVSLPQEEDDMKAAYIIVQDKQQGEEYGSMAVCGPMVPEGWKQLSSGLGDRSAVDYWRAILTVVTGPLGDDVHVDLNGWAMARDAFSNIQKMLDRVNDGVIGVLRGPEAQNIVHDASRDDYQRRS
ncbi:hypothetical protein BH09ACT9_BH09ACT9_00790 [soil metagenome]